MVNRMACHLVKEALKSCKNYGAEKALRSAARVLGAPKVTCEPHTRFKVFDPRRHKSHKLSLMLADVGRVCKTKADELINDAVREMARDPSFEAKELRDFMSECSLARIQREMFGR